MLDTQKTSPEAREKVLQVVPKCPYVKLAACTKTILEILGNYPEDTTRKSLREQMMRKGYPELSDSEGIKDNGERRPNHLGWQNFLPNQLIRKSTDREEDS